MTEARLTLDDDDKVYILIGGRRAAIQWARDNDKLGSSSFAPFARNVILVSGRWDVSRIRATTRTPEVVWLPGCNLGNYDLADLHQSLDQCQMRAEAFQKHRRKDGSPPQEGLPNSRSDEEDVEREDPHYT